MLKVLDLFSGIGGFSLGLERAGMKTIAFCEIEDFPRKVLRKHWPDVPIFEDVRKLHAADLPEPVDVICGGFPCQPFSECGKRKGKDDDRYLWPEMFRIIKECKPTWVIGENVTGLDGLGLEQSASDLESIGYEVAPRWKYRLVPLGMTTYERGCGFLHTPTTQDCKPAGEVEMRMVQKWLAGGYCKNTYIRLRSLLAALAGKRLPPNPEYLECMMGFPIGWTEIGH